MKAIRLEGSQFKSYGGTGVTTTAALVPDAPHDTPKGAALRLTILVLVSSLLYTLFGVVWTRGIWPSLSGMFLATIVILVLIAGCAAIATIALKVGRYVGETSNAKFRERKVSAGLFAIFMLVVSVVSAWLGMQDFSLTTKGVPINFWLAIPPASAFVIVSHPERRLDKLICGLLSFGAYSTICALKFWLVTAAILQSIHLSLEMFSRNYVIYWYLVAFVCGFLTDVTNFVFIATEWIFKSVELLVKKLGHNMEAARRGDE